MITVLFYNWGLDVSERNYTDIRSHIDHGVNDIPDVYLAPAVSREKITGTNLKDSH